MLVAHGERMMGKHTYSRWISLPGWGATGPVFAAATRAAPGLGPRLSPTGHLASRLAR